MHHKKIALLLSVTLIPLITLSYLYLDLPVGRWAIAHDDTIYYELGEWFSLLGEATYPLVIAALLWLFWKFKTKNEAFASRASFLFLSIIITGVTANIVKAIFGKARPILLKNEEEFGFSWFVLPNDYNHHSFPSGHTTMAFTVATALALMFPKWWPAFYAYAITVAFARIGAWDHYPSDVLAGALYGTVLTLALFHWKKISFKSQEDS